MGERMNETEFASIYGIDKGKTIPYFGVRSDIQEI